MSKCDVFEEFDLFHAKSVLNATDFNAISQQLLHMGNDLWNSDQLLAAMYRKDWLSLGVGQLSKGTGGRQAQKVALRHVQKERVAQRLLLEEEEVSALVCDQL